MSKTTDYEKIRAVWYKKLKEEHGFIDIEQDEDNLKTWSTEFNRKKDWDLWQAQAAYYYMAEKFLAEYPFESELDKVVWEYHTNGISMRNIVKLLKDVNIKSSKSVLGRVIKNLENIMKNMYLIGHKESNE